MDCPGMNYTVQLMASSGHMQTKNDDNMRIAVDDIFLGGLDGMFLNIEERPLRINYFC